MSDTTEKLSDFFRLGASLGTPHTSSNYTLSAGFGSTATVTLSNCTDNAGRVTVVCGGTGQAFGPTCTIAYDQAATRRAPHVLLTRGGGSQATIIMSVTTEQTTSCVVTFNGTAAGTEQYVFNYWAIG